MTKFGELGIKTSILQGLAKMGFEDTFPIQAATIPVLLQGRDVVGQAHTGSGKTAAFGVPMLNNIDAGGRIQGLIMAPTRELANQITDEIKKFGRFTGIKVVTIYGGQGMGIQLDALGRHPEIVVATPGRLIDHIKRGSIDLKDITHVVLDEADTMLDMGFIDDIKFVLQLTPEEKTMSMFSATMPVDILRLAEEYLKDAKQFLLDADDLSGEGIDQSYLVIKDRDKPKHLVDFLENNDGRQCIVFCSTKYRTRDVAHMLRKKFETVAIEGDMSQPRREASMSRFRQGKAEILVATDVASRGIDVPRVSLVVNYDVPNQEMTYFHRIGRTARAGAKGRAITLVSYSSIGDFNIIKRQIKVDLKDLNKEMGIEIALPDPLKRDVAPRRYGAYSRENRGRGRSGGGRRDGGFGGRRDNRDGGFGGGGRRDNRDGGFGGRRDGGFGGGRRDGGFGGGRRDGGFGGRRDNRDGGFGGGGRRDNRDGGFGGGGRRDNRDGGFGGRRDGGFGGGGRRDNRDGGFGGRRDGGFGGGGRRDNRDGGFGGRRDNRDGGRRDNRDGGFGGRRDGGFDKQRDSKGGFGRDAGFNRNDKKDSYRNQRNEGGKRYDGGSGGNKFEGQSDERKKHNNFRSRW